HREPLRQQRAEQPFAALAYIVVRPGTVDDAIHVQMRALVRAAWAPPDRDLVAREPHAENATGVHVQLPPTPQVVQGRPGVLGETVAMHVPVSAQVPQEAPALAGGETAPQPGSEVTQERHRTAPVTGAPLHLLGERAKRSEQTRQ